MLFLLPISSVFATEEVKTLNIGAAKVSYNYQPTDTGVETLTLVALVSETNNSRTEKYGSTPSEQARAIDLPVQTDALQER
jgi:hypothetical protein